MNYLFQYEDGDGNIVTRMTSGQDIIEVYGCSDFNCTSNHHVYLPTNKFGVFEECKIMRAYTNVVDKYEHMDIYCAIVDSKGDVLGTFSYQEH